MVWYQHISSTSAHKVLHTDQDAPAPSVIKAVMMPLKPIHSAAIRWGQDNEDRVFKAYAADVSEVHTTATVKQTGMRIHPTHHWLSASADGVIKHQCHGKGILEIKCPNTWRECRKR